MIKRETLISIERNIQNQYINYSSVPDYEKKKFFVTFPFPYMNGTLHLGHAYTLTKAEFMARYKSLKGYNVLFPFAYHGTGMPIVACAKKLCDELDKYFEKKLINSHSEEYKYVYNNNVPFEEFVKKLPNTNQIKILYGMNINPQDIDKFIYPEYWIKYFPMIAQRDLKNFGALIDHTRSFITTDLNPYYDRFVKWQFEKLSEKNLLKFGKRYVIYSKLDDQPCADHDRTIGEGIEPAEYQIILIEKKDGINYIFTRVPEKYYTSKIYFYINKKDKFIKFKYNEKYYACNEKSFNNLSYQLDNITFVDYYIPQFDKYLESNSSKGTGMYVSNYDFDEPCSISNPESDFRYFEPENEVISRSGDKCIVAKCNQWFINYGDELLKSKVNNFIEKEFKTTNPQVLVQLKKASDWINEWPCSRHCGLGTKLLDTTYLIDSLSDSTIYMSFYTISHLINQLPEHKVTPDLFDYIFLNKNFSDNVHSNNEIELINQMKKEFEYWYPVDIRVSGKDLINNHLIMSIYNHMAIWDDVKLAPQSFELNGHILLNGKKMSKSTGNFKTLEQAIKEYGADVTRLTLSEGFGLDDPDFRDAIAEGNLLRLYAEKEWFEKLIDNLPNYKNDSDYNFWDIVFDTEIDNAFCSAEKAYDNNNFRMVVYSGFNKLLVARDKYRLLYEKKVILPNCRLLKKFIDTILLIIYPICPHLVEYLWNKMMERNLSVNKYWNNNKEIHNHIYQYYSINIYNLINKINGDITKLNKKKKIIKNINITLYEKYSVEESQIINMVYAYNNKAELSWKEFLNTLKLISIDKFSKHAEFAKFIYEKIGIFGNNYLEKRDPLEELEIMKKWIPYFLNNKYDINICLVENNNDVKYINGPDSPNIEINLF